MKNKARDIIVLVIAVVIIIASSFLIIKLLNPPAAKKTATSEADNIKSIPTEFDENTFERINSLADYGEPVLENLGKSDLFANY